MGSISRGFHLAGASWRVVRADASLLWLPAFSFLSLLVVSAVFGLGAFGIGLPEKGQSPSPALYVLGFCFYVAAAFVTIFFNAAVIGTAMKRLKGEPASIGDGFALARRHVGKIFVWAVITATVGMILRAIQERAGILGRILIGIIGIAWNLITFFVVPVLLYEPLGVGASIKRSASIFKERWGETFVGNATIGLALFIVSLGVILLAGGLVALVPGAAIAFIVVAVLALAVIAAVGAAMSGVFNAALYRYATTGETSGAFTEDDLNNTFRHRRGSRPPAGIA